MERHYRFAGVELTVCLPDGRVHTDQRHLASFAAESVTDPHVFRFQVVQTLDAPTGVCIAEDPAFRVYADGEKRIRYIGSGDAHIRVCREGKQHAVQLLSQCYPGPIGAKAVLNSIAAEHLVAQAGGFVFHCSYISHNGKAILFTAPSETGKSTQAELWNKLRGAQIINGDRAAVRIADGRALAEGIPFAGSSQYCRNCSLPIEAIVYLGQAPVTTIRRMKGFEAFARIWEGVSVNTWDKMDVELASAAVGHLAQAVPVYHLPCTPDESAVTALENALKSR